MCCEIRYAAHCIALDFDIRTEHLSNKRLEATQFDDEKLVLN